MKKIKNYYSNLNLKNKLRFSFILLILIPAACICIVYYIVASQSILDVAEKNILDVTVKNTEIIDSRLEIIENSAVNLNVDPELYQVLEEVKSAKESELLAMDKRVYAILQKYFSGEYVLSATILTPRYVFGDNTGMVIPWSRFAESDIYGKIAEQKGKSSWVPTYLVKREFELDYAVDNDTVFSLAQILNPVYIAPETPNYIRYLEEGEEAAFIISFDERLIRENFEGSNSVEGATFCVSSPMGEIVSHSDSKKNGSKEKLPWLREAAASDSGSVLLTYEGERVIVCYAKSEITGWISASITPVSSLLNNVSRLQFITLLLCTILFMLAMFLAAIFSRRITQPVEQLVLAMKQAGTGNFGMRLPTKGTDEIQYLTEKYNEMGEKIEILIDENYKGKIREKEAEIQALNLQMNPHFLYNSLNIINMMALEEGNEEISQMLISLSDMLQYTFRNRQEKVVFEEEFLWLQNYLHIMQIRFEQLFDVSYEVAEEIFQYRIPKLLLQPLVENAIVHGFRGMKEKGHLTLEGAKEGGDIVIGIRDNGRGMNKEELEKAMNGDNQRIGISNAVERLSLIYGERAELDIFTECGKGTLVKIRIPAEAADRQS